MLVSASQAYSEVMGLDPHTVQLLAEGKFPTGWKNPRVAAYMLAAGQFISAAKGAETGPTSRTAPSTPAAIEIANRTEGKVPDRLAVEHRGVIALPLVQVGREQWTEMAALELLRGQEEAIEGEPLGEYGSGTDGLSEARSAEHLTSHSLSECSVCGSPECGTHPRVMV